MIQFICEHWLDCLVLLLLAVIVGACIHSLFSKKRRSACAGCPGCGSCTKCSGCGSCVKPETKNK